MNDSPLPAGWPDWAVLIGRIVLALVFLMALAGKVMMFEPTAGFIASAGFPFPSLLTVLAALLELAIVLALLTGAYFSEMMLLGAVYVVFLAFAFHGPSHWAGNQAEFGFFVDHFTFLAGLLFAAVHGPGKVLAMRKTIIGRS